MRILILSIVFLLSFYQQANACSCYRAPDSPQLQVEIFEYNTVVLKGKVKKIKKPPFWNEPFIDDYIIEAEIEPIKVYKGDVTENIFVLNETVSKKRAGINCPKTPKLKEGEVYTLALKYDKKLETYIKQHQCGTLPQLYLFEDIQKVKDITQHSNVSQSPFLDKLKACKSYIVDDKITHNLTSLLNYYNQPELDNPIIITTQKNKKISIQKVFYNMKQQFPMIFAKDEKDFYYFLNCDYEIPKRWHPGGLQ